MTTWTREIIEVSLQRSTIIAMITSVEALSIVSREDLKLLGDPHMAIVGGWCLDHFSKYNAAPKQKIQDIFNAHRSNGLDPERAELIEIFLVSESAEYEEKGNADWHYDQFNAFIKEQRQRVHRERLEEYAGNHAAFDDEARRYAAEAQADEGKDLSEVLRACTRPFHEFVKIKFPEPRFIIGDWLREKGVYLISSPAGVGKTWFIMELGAAAANYRPAMDERWETNHICPTLIIDGEMDPFDIQERGRMVGQVGLGNCETVSKSEMETMGINMNLAEEKSRTILEKHIIERGFKLVIFDNLYSLFIGQDLNSAQEWGVINDWFRHLKALGITIILVHHTGHDKSRQTGTAAREFNIDLGLVLNDARKEEDGENCCFTIRVTKRRRASGLEGKRYKCVNGHWTVMDDKKAAVEANKAAIARMLVEGMAGVKIAAALKCTPARISQLRTEMIQEGIIREIEGRKMELTEKGETWLQE